MSNMLSLVSLLTWAEILSGYGKSFDTVRNFLIAGIVEWVHSAIQYAWPEKFTRTHTVFNYLRDYLLNLSSNILSTYFMVYYLFQMLNGVNGTHKTSDDFYKEDAYYFSLVATQYTTAIIVAVGQYYEAPHHDQVKELQRSYPAAFEGHAGLHSQDLFSNSSDSDINEYDEEEVFEYQLPLRALRPN